jgi:hypothetical protein
MVTSRNQILWSLEPCESPGEFRCVFNHRRQWWRWRRSEQFPIRVVQQDERNGRMHLGLKHSNPLRDLYRDKMFRSVHPEHVQLLEEKSEPRSRWRLIPLTQT